MIKLNKIYFDGKSYAQTLSQEKESYTQEEINLVSSFNFTPIDSISFKDYQPQTYCDITIGENLIQAVNVTHLYTDISRKNITVLYPSHNPTFNPAASY